MPQWAEVIARLIAGVLNAINRKNKKDAVDNSADTISNGGRVQSSKSTYADLSSESKRDET